MQKLKLAVLLIAKIIMLVQAGDLNAQQFEIKWQAQQSGLSSSLRGLCAVNKKIVWASGTRGSFARTIDGGQTWFADSVSGATNLDFRDVQAFDANRAYLMSAGSGELSRIYKTVDGGKSWQLQHQNKIPEGFFNGMAFWDADNGVVIGDPVNGRLFILLTSDGGATWQQLAGVPEVVAGEYGFAASGTGVAVYGKQQLWIATGGATARVFYTPDRGKTWRIADTLIVSGNQSSGIFSIAFRDEKHGVIAGGDYQKPNEAKGNIAFTNDGGKTWRLLKNPEAVGFLSCVAYVPQKPFSLLLAVGTSGSYFSQDDGLSWNKFSAEGYHTMSFAQSTYTGWAAGADGRIAKCIITPNNVK